MSYLVNKKKRHFPNNNQFARYMRENEKMD